MTIEQAKRIAMTALNEAFSTAEWEDLSNGDRVQRISLRGVVCRVRLTDEELRELCELVGAQCSNGETDPIVCQCVAVEAVRILLEEPKEQPHDCRCEPPPATRH